MMEGSKILTYFWFLLFIKAIDLSFSVTDLSDQQFMLSSAELQKYMVHFKNMKNLSNTWQIFKLLKS